MYSVQLVTTAGESRFQKLTDVQTLQRSMSMDQCAKLIERAIFRIESLSTASVVKQFETNLSSACKSQAVWCFGCTKSCTWTDVSSGGVNVTRDGSSIDVSSLEASERLFGGGRWGGNGYGLDFNLGKA